MSMVDLETVFDRLTSFPILAFEDGDVVLSEGSTTGRLLFLIHGAVDVMKGNWVLARVSEPGAMFGDMALLRGKPHSADVLAVRPSSFYVVDRAEAFLKAEPLVALYVAAVQSGRLDAVNQHLIEARDHIARSGERRGLFVDVLNKIGGALHAPA